MFLPAFSSFQISEIDRFYSTSMVGDSEKSKSRKKVAKKEDPYTFTSSVTETHKSSIYGANFNPYIPPTKGYWLATCGGRSVNVYFLKSGDKKLDNMVQFQDPNKDECFYSVSWAIDEVCKANVVVVGGAKGIIRVIDPKRKETVTTLRGHGESVNELRTSPANSMIIASASKDRTARLWHIRNANCLAIFGGAEGHLDEVISLDFDQNQQYLMTASMDHSIRMWDMRAETEVGQRVRQALDVRGFDELSKLAAVEAHYPVAVAKDVHTNYVDCVRFYGDMIVSKSCENIICIWKFGGFDTGPAGEGSKFKTETYVLHTIWFHLPRAAMWFIKFDIHPNNLYFACGNEAGDVFLYGLGDLRGPDSKEEADCVVSNPDTRACIRQTVFSPDGQILITAGDEGQLVRYDAK